MKGPGPDSGLGPFQGTSAIRKGIRNKSSGVERERESGGNGLLNPMEKR